MGQVHEDSHARRLSSFPEKTLALGSRQLGCLPRPTSWAEPHCPHAQETLQEVVKWLQRFAVGRGLGEGGGPRLRPSTSADRPQEHSVASWPPASQRPAGSPTLAQC